MGCTPELPMWAANFTQQILNTPTGATQKSIKCLFMGKFHVIDSE